MRAVLTSASCWWAASAVDVIVDSRGKELRGWDPSSSDRRRPSSWAEMRSQESLGDSSATDICAVLGVDDFSKVGCGACASACRRGANNGPQMETGDAVEVTSQTECFRLCREAGEGQCAAVTLDWSERRCTMHKHPPLGSACAGSDACEPEGEENHQISSCQAQACFVMKEAYTAHAKVRTMGAGACARDESHRDKDKFGKTMRALDVDASYAVSVEGTDRSAFVDACKAKCDGLLECRSVTVGKRVKCTGSGCEDLEYMCELSSTTATQASTIPYTMRAEACQKYCDNPDADVLRMSCAECNATEMSCLVKSVREHKGSVRRGPGLCLAASGAESEILMNLTFSTPLGCEQECDSDPLCTGGAYSSDDPMSFCRLYRGEVQQASLHKLALEVCQDCQAADREARGLSQGCTCGSANSGSPQDFAWGADPGCFDCYDPLCCKECHSCQEQFRSASECFAKAFV